MSSLASAGKRNHRPKSNSVRPAKQAKFMLFVDTLFRYLEISASPDLTNRTRHVILECTRRNRSGEMGYTPLSRSILIRVHQTVGNIEWERAQAFFRLSMEFQRTKLAAARVSAGPTKVENQKAHTQTSQLLLQKQQKTIIRYPDDV
jgi:hypothetical protein